MSHDDRLDPTTLMLPFDGRPPFVAGSDTSEAAADSVAEGASSMRALVLREVGAAIDGLTCDEVEARLVMRHQTASARLRELALTREIVDSGRRRKTRSGRDAAVWRVA